MIAQRRRSNWELELPFFRQVVNRFLRDLRIDGSFLFETGQQLAHGARVEQRTAETMLTDLARLLQQ